MLRRKPSNVLSAQRSLVSPSMQMKKQRRRPIVQRNSDWKARKLTFMAWTVLCQSGGREREGAKSKVADVEVLRDKMGVMGVVETHVVVSLVVMELGKLVVVAVRVEEEVGESLMIPPRRPRLKLER